MSVDKFEALCVMNGADKVRVTKDCADFSITVCEGGRESWCYLSFEDALALADYIVTELEEEEV